MKSFYRICAWVLAAVALIFAAANLYLNQAEQPSGGRPWRVEVSRLVLRLQEGNDFDISECEYVTAVTVYSDDPEGFWEPESEYLIREVNGKLYRFDYTRTTGESLSGIIWGVNGLLLGMALLILVVLLYIRQKILKPFETLTEVPYELSKGNLTVPIKENRNRFFGRFVWGVDLLRENMEQQKQRELELQREKKTLLLSLSHDLKTPLSTIKLYAKALSKGLYKDTDRQVEIAESINTKADEIEGYVSQIIRASNEDFLSLEVQNGEFYLSELVETVGVFYREKLALVQTSFSVGAYSNCLLRGDLDRSVEVIQNILENAIKYGDGQRIGMDISEEEGCILVRVENSGCTLPPVELPHIFESFWRGSNSEHQKGSGLGLYICRQLMHKMGGEVFAQIKSGNMTVTAVFGKA